LLSSASNRLNISLLKAADFNEKLHERACNRDLSIQKICSAAKDENETETRNTGQTCWYPKRYDNTRRRHKEWLSHQNSIDEDKFIGSPVIWFAERKRDVDVPTEEAVLQFNDWYTSAKGKKAKWSGRDKS